MVLLRKRKIASTLGAALFLLAAVMIYVAGKGLMEVRPASDYEDAGTKMFVPYQVLPVQVANTRASGRSRRMNPTRTEYRVYYRASGGYKWYERVVTRTAGEHVVEAGIAVERRILRIPADKAYITVEPDQTAKSYTAGLRSRYMWSLGISGAYILVYLGGWCVLWLSKGPEERKAPEREPYPWERKR